MTMIDDLVVQTKSGTLRGARENGLTVFRGVPYAAAPVGELRFAPPQPVAPWRDVRDATRDGPVPPQGRSRLAHVMGDFERPQSEDCLTLNIWTRATDGKKRPVMVWIHGGAFSSGAGSLPWYSGERFALNGDVVVVSINYRLGALGFLCLPGVSPGNLGLLDQVAALKFVRDNIAAFGGNPDNVTVVGQSAGGASISILMTMPLAAGLFRRAILQSAPFGRPARTLEDSHRIGRRFLEVLGLKPEQADALKSLPFAKLVAAQGEVGRLEKKFADTQAPFWPVIDGDVYPGEVGPALAAGAGRDIDVMVGTTREEMAAFYGIDPDIPKADAAAIEGVFAAMFKTGHRAVYDETRRMRASSGNAALLGDLMTDVNFRMGSLRFAEARADQGRPAYVFQFDWQSPEGFEACHCIEIPFVFNNFEHWTDAPMVKGADPKVASGLAEAMHRAWIAFARTGKPDHPGLPVWPAYRREDRMTMRFDTMIGPVSDLAGLNWRTPWTR
ncbi:carboxylesterase/lipase family protein [Rhodoplanes sp. Z2-YC6860]|uniref:carboxylesterase/lipase family protein n=1 Tax=Rhodoplanes sp. Z2-YC6860 TaxID=674703 RepID=UPI00078EB97B|nr:carboxylesterase/lipase family protein [Rhodoplanes sp. Z2-YC6860]AMN39016.1 carboxylesterase type B [Rhodoplanes sp. Z2-YC6860]